MVWNDGFGFCLALLFDFLWKSWVWGSTPWVSALRGGRGAVAAGGTSSAGEAL